MTMAEEGIVITVASVPVDVPPTGPFTKIRSIAVQLVDWILCFKHDDPPEAEENQIPPSKQETNVSMPAAAEASDSVFAHHPVVVVMRSQDLGKMVLSFSVPVTIVVLFSSNGKSHTRWVYFMLSGLSVGCVAIWNGILLRETFPRTANVSEQLGIIVVFVSFYGLVASGLPTVFVWVPVLCGCFCVVPFVVAALPDHHPRTA